MIAGIVIMIIVGAYAIYQTIKVKRMWQHVEDLLEATDHFRKAVRLQNEVIRVLRKERGVLLELMIRRRPEESGADGWSISSTLDAVTEPSDSKTSPGDEAVEPMPSQGKGKGKTTFS